MFTKNVSSFLLISLMTVAFFGIANVSHGAEEGMADGCPFSVMDTVPCLRGGFSELEHHLSSYRSFSNAFVGSTSIALVLLLALSVWFVVIKPPPAARLGFIPVNLNAPPVGSYHRKVARWLSFFENSPSVV